MLMPDTIARVAGDIAVQARMFIMLNDRWYLLMILGIPVSLLLFFIELSQRQSCLYVFHSLCAIIYYTYVRAQPTFTAYWTLASFAYVAFSVQVKLFICSALPTDAGYALPYDPNRILIAFGLEYIAMCPEFRG